MEAGYGLSSTHECGGLGLRVCEIQVLSRIQAPQPPYDTLGIQVDILHGMGTSAVGPCRWVVLCPSNHLFHCEEKGIGENGFQDPWYNDFDRISGCARLVDGEIGIER